MRTTRRALLLTALFAILASGFPAGPASAQSASTATISPGPAGPDYEPLGAARLRAFSVISGQLFGADEVYVGVHPLSSDRRVSEDVKWVRQPRRNDFVLEYDPVADELSVTIQNRRHPGGRTTTFPEFSTALDSSGLAAADTVELRLHEQIPLLQRVALEDLELDGEPLGTIEVPGSDLSPREAVFSVAGQLGDGFVLTGRLALSGLFLPSADASRVDITFGPSEPAAADLSADVEPGTFTEEVSAGLAVTYPVVVTNEGGSLATGVVLDYTPPIGLNLSEPLPPGCVGVAVITCELGDLSSAESTTVTFDLVADAGVVPGTTLFSSAVVSATGVDPVPGNNTAAWATTVPTAGIAGAVPPEGAGFELPADDDIGGALVTFPESPKGLSISSLSVTTAPCLAADCGPGVDLVVAPTVDWDAVVVVELTSLPEIDPQTGLPDVRQAELLVFNRLVEPYFSLEEEPTTFELAPECAGPTGNFFRYGVGPDNQPPVADPAPVCWNSIQVNRDASITVEFAVQTRFDPHFSWR